METGTVMKSLTALLAAMILCAGIGASNAAVRIVDDPGGQIGIYVDKYQGMRSAGEMGQLDLLVVHRGRQGSDRQP